MGLLSMATHGLANSGPRGQAPAPSAPCSMPRGFFHVMGAAAEALVGRVLLFCSCCALGFEACLCLKVGTV